MRRNFFYFPALRYACLDLKTVSFSEHAGDNETAKKDSFIQFYFELPQSLFVFSSLESAMLEPETHFGCIPLETGNFIIGWSGFVIFFTASFVEVFFIIFKAFFDDDDECDERRIGRILWRKFVFGLIKN
jgi:hypothetical protein